MLASMFIAGGYQALRNHEALTEPARRVTDKIVPLAQDAGLPLSDDPATLVRLNGLAQVVGGAALATGRMPRLASTLLAATLVPTTLAGHRFWEEEDDGAKANQQVHFFKNVSMLGGLLLAGVDTEGKPGVAWRARRAAVDAKREARHLAATARREAKLAKAQLT